MAIRVIFITRDGERVAAEGRAGQKLLDVAQAAGMPLEGTCEGQRIGSSTRGCVAWAKYGEEGWVWVESLVVAAAEIAAVAWGDRRTLAMAVFSQGVLIVHGLSRRSAETVSRQG